MSLPVGKADIVRGTAWSVSGQVAGLVLPILLTPYVVAKLGLDRYGYWVVLNAAAAWLTHYDLGLSGAVSREAARRRAQDDLPGLARLAGTWLRYDLACIVVLGLLATAAACLLPPEDRVVAVLVSIQALLVPLHRHLHSTLLGMQGIARASRLELLVLPLGAAGTVGVLHLGWGLTGLAGNGLFWVVLQWVALGGMLRAAGHPAPGKGARDDLASLRSFGMRASLGQVVNQAFRSDRLFLAISGLPPASIAAYQFGAGLSERLAGLVAGLSAALPAALTDLEARGDSGRFRSLVLRGARIHGVAALFLLGFLACFAPELLRFWLGMEPPGSATVLRVAAAGLLAGVLASPVHAATAALGMPGRSTLTQAVGLGVALMLYTIAGHRYDGPGLAASLACGWVAAQVLLVGVMRRRIGYTWGEYAGNAFLKPSAVWIPVLCAFLVWRFMAGGGPGPGRWEALKVLAPAFGGAALLAWPAARLTGAIERDDVGLLRSLGRRETA